MNEKQVFWRLKVLRYFLVFLTVMLAMTLVARGIYAYRLPQVKAGAMLHTALEYKVECSGTICAQNEIPVIATEGLRIAEICVKSGDTVHRRETILKYDTDYLKECIRKLEEEIAIDKLTRSDYYQAQAWNSAKILTYSMENCQRKLEQYRQLLEDGAELSCPRNGVVTEMKVSAGDITGETAVLVLADTTGEIYFAGEMTEEDSKLVSKGDLVTLYFRNDRMILEECEIGEIIAQESGVYRFTVLIESGQLQVGEIGTMETKVVTEDEYDCVPLDAIYEDSYVYIIEEAEGFLGKEYHASIHRVNILKRNETYAVVTGSGLTENDKIMCGANKEIFDGQIVRLVE